VAEATAVISKEDLIDLNRALAMQATLGRPALWLAQGSPLPHFWHWAYFWDAQPKQKLGQDGHPKTGDFIPDTGFPRRMWAGGSLRFAGKLEIGKVAKRTSRIASVEHKTGKSGPMALVSVDHEIWSGETLVITERQSLVYLPERSPSDQKPVPRFEDVQAEKSQDFCADTTLLFRYSALTFNGHRIHYDLSYAQEVEGYSGLVIHGPLLAQYLIDMAEDRLGALRKFSFRAIAPLFHQESFTANLASVDGELRLWIAGPDNRLIMQATAG
jgi:3-methylfumaryl-CoA hydratase